MSADWDPYTFTDDIEGGTDASDFNIPPPTLVIPRLEVDQGADDADRVDVEEPLEDEDASSPSDGSQQLATFRDAFMSADTFARKGAARKLLEVFRDLYYSDGDLSVVTTVIEKLAEDAEQSVRTELVEQLPHLALFCHEESPGLDHIVPKHVLPHIVKLLTDHFTQVRQSAQNGLMFLLERGIIASSQVAKCVLPVIVGYTYAYAPVELRAEMTMFMVKMAPLTGKEIAVNCFLDLYCKLCEDSIFQVRKACAMGMGDMANVVGTRLTEEILLPKFLTLCKDTVWGVRKGCAEVFTVVATMSQLVTRKKTLAPAFTELLQDSSRWVRISAYQTLGSFITTFAVEDSSSYSQESSEIEQSFIDRYLACQSQDTDTQNISDAESRFCNIVKTREDERLMPLKTAPDSSDDEECTLESKYSSANAEKYCCDGLADAVTAKEMLVTLTEDTSEVVMSSELLCDASDVTSNLATDHCEAGLSKSETAESIEDLSAQMTISDVSETVPSVLPEQSDDSAIGSPVETEQLTDINSSLERDASSNEFDIGLNIPTPDQVEMQKPFESSKLELNIINEEVKAEGSFSNGDAAELSAVKDAVSILSITEQDDAEPMEMDQGYREADITDELMEEPCTALDFRPRLPCILSPLQGSRKKQTFSSCESSNSEGRVHRSYANLYKATKDTGGPEDPFLSGRFRGFENYFNEEADTDSASGDELRLDIGGWTVRDNRPRLLEELPKSLTPLQQDVVPVDLLQHYTSMCEPLSNPARDNALTSFCAFNLPAVVLTLGPQNWSILRDCYESLACNMQWKIRYTLACSLHELARVIGPELAERDLLPFFRQLVKDVDEVRVGLLKNLYNFVKILGVVERKNCLETLQSFLETDNKRNWRFRLELSQQLELLVDLYGADDIYKFLRPVAVDLLKDSVAEVRKASLNVIARIFIRISQCSEENPTNYVHQFLTELVELLSRSDKWVRRQTFAALAGNLVQMDALQPKQFADDILPHLVTLSTDTVPNVRLIVAQTMIAVATYDELDNESKELVANVLETLQEDSDQDVRFYCSKSSFEEEITD